ncbi:MAG: hypothetical protein R2754_03270 [Microthrixaceae bacterium]
MDRPGDPVEVALRERRARRVSQTNLERGASLADRCADAAERGLAVRAHLTGGTIVSGAAASSDAWSLSVLRRHPGGSPSLTVVVVSSVVRLTVADAGRPAPRAPQPASPSGDHRTLVALLAGIAERGSDVAVNTADGAGITGGLTSVSEHLVGIETGRRGTGGLGGQNHLSDWVDWIDPTHIVAVAELG